MKIEGKDKDNDDFIVSLLLETWYDARRKTGCRFILDPCEGCLVINTCKVGSFWLVYSKAKAEYDKYWTQQIDEREKGDIR